jgi:hypothetical protein
MNDCTRILEYMKTHGSITGQQATKELNIMDYRKRISELRHAGTGIKSVWRFHRNADGKRSRYYEYSLEEA